MRSTVITVLNSHSTTLSNTVIQGHKQCPAGRVFQNRVGSGRVLDKILGSGSGSGRLRSILGLLSSSRVMCWMGQMDGMVWDGYYRS